MARRQAQKGAARPSAWPLTRWIFDQIHLKTDFGGRPIAFHLTGGEASDSRNFDVLLDIGPDINPRAALGDKGYDSKSNRAAARQRGGCPAIPHRSNTKDSPAFFPKVLYKARARIEQAVGKLKRIKCRHDAPNGPRPQASIRTNTASTAASGASAASTRRELAPLISAGSGRLHALGATVLVGREPPASFVNKR